MMLNKMPCHHTTFVQRISGFFSFFLPDHGVMDCIDFTSRYEKFMCYYVSILSKKSFDIICHDVHVHLLHLYKIH